jgi:hypothetical protein
MKEHFNAALSKHFEIARDEDSIGNIRDKRLKILPTATGRERSHSSCCRRNPADPGNPFSCQW